ncbi:MAG: lipoprotein [Marmoricola sp.]
MSRSNPRRFVVAGALPVAALAVTLAACGSGGSGYNYGPAGASSPSASTSEGSETIGITTGSVGTYLTGDGGRSVYLWMGDRGAASSCSSACASVWPPVTTSGAPKAGSGVKASDLGTIKRSDGSTQVTYGGHPLYYYAPDASKGQTTGQGSTSFGAQWWLVSPTGSAITQTSSGSSSPSVPRY